MTIYESLHKKTRRNRLPSLMLFFAASTIGFLFLSNPHADQQALPYEMELDQSVRSLVTTGENDIVVAGDFARLIKIGSGGEVDTDFGGREAPGFNARVLDIKNSHDGGFYVAGEFTTYNQSLLGFFGKLDKNGEIDNDFAVQAGTGFDEAASVILTRKNGNTIVGGKFESYNGSFAPYLVELDGQGRLLRHFDVNGPIHTMKFVGQDAIAIGGEFEKIGDVQTGSFAIVSLKEVQ